MPDLKRTAKWIGYFPAGLVAGVIFFVVFTSIGDWLFGKNVFPSSVILFMAAAVLPGATLEVGSEIAPRQPNKDQIPATRWVLLAPYIAMSLLLVFQFFILGFEMRFFGETEFFSSLSTRAENLIMSAGIVFGTVGYVVSETIDALGRRSLHASNMDVAAPH